ncbi:MAG: hypothetical protein NTZ95_04095 [Candidatus Omnitrophica bacterium]|nr:hypothetical protein [Candidatus Omnitrophota bacterium]
MKDKNLVVIAIGLIVIVGVAVLIINGNNEYATQSMKAANAVNALLMQQKDFEIKKLVKRLDAKQKELNDAKAMLESVKQKIENVKTDLGNITGKPSVQ